MKRLILCATVFGLVTLGACNKKSENPPPGPASGTVATAPVDAPPPIDASAGSAAAAAAPDVPTPEDFEADAEKKITDKNVEAQVKAIEHDLEPAK